MKNWSILSLVNETNLSYNFLIFKSFYVIAFDSILDSLTSS